MRKNEMKKDLWDSIVADMTMISESNKQTAQKLGYEFVENTEFLYRLNEVIRNEDKYLEEEASGLIFEKEGEDYYLVFQGRDLLFSKEQIQEFAAKLICTFEEVLPLGTVVEIKKDLFPKDSNFKKVDHMRIMITHRFLQSGEGHHYFPYGGISYPIGFVEQNQVFQFTPQLIQTVLHMGYQDEEEDVFVFLLKKELIQNQGMTSYAFASRKEVLKYGR